MGFDKLVCYFLFYAFIYEDLMNIDLRVDVGMDTKLRKIDVVEDKVAGVGARYTASLKLCEA